MTGERDDEWMGICKKYRPITFHKSFCRAEKQMDNDVWSRLSAENARDEFKRNA